MVNGKDVENQLAKDATEALLNDPAVRDAARDQAVNMMNDPEFQQAAKEKAKKGLKTGVEYGRRGILAFRSYVEAGPAGIQILCFLAGCLTLVVGIMKLANLFAIFDPFCLIMNIYTVIFGIVTICVEADVDRLQETPFLNFFADRVFSTQEYLNVNAKFLTLLGGRGLFYFGVGLVMMLRCTSIFCLFFIAGVANIVTGVLCIMLHYGYTPDYTRMQEAAAKATMEITGSPREFDQAEEAYSAKRDGLSSKTQKEMDAILKQAQKGDLNPQLEPRPVGLFNMRAKAEWEARKKLLGKTMDEAKELFVIRARVENICEK